MAEGEDKVALVTGAGTGIGRNVALTLLARGYKVVLTGRRRAPLEETAALSKNAGNALALAADVSKPGDVAKLFEGTTETFGRIDVVFNNAGMGGPKAPLEDITPEQWLEVVGVNLNGAFFVAQAAFRAMKAQTPQGGRIINNGSISAAVPRPNSAPYTATKHAITGLTRALSLDGRKYNIACGQIDIGNAATDMTRAMQAGILQPNGQTMVEPTMSVDNVGEAVAFMAALPLNANVQFMTVMATGMPFIGRG
ncbi:MAG: SDR family oxidoreductase [Rhodospirillaceae bacterium]|nr:SDR family oxidoreductase [Rhodospirillaceae bacterium]